ncbi:MAG: NAD-dependent epimerase/dehydratase family protein [Myxococcota bacterium]
MILVTGGSGVMGARIVRGLIRRGARVRALVLPADPLNVRLGDVDCEIWEADITDAASVAGALDGVHTVYHLAAVILADDPSIFERVNVGGTRNVVNAAAAAGSEHFVYVSSASVTYPRRTPYAESKLAAEQIVLEQEQMRTTIVRPTLLYDVGGGIEFMMFLDYLRRFPVVPFIGPGTALKRPVWVGDLVQGLVAIAGNETAYGKMYNLSGPEAMPIAEMARIMLEHHHVWRPFLHLPTPLCNAAATLLDAVMRRPPLTHSAIAGIIQDADLDCSAARRDLGYRPLTFRDGLRRCFPS